MFNKRVPVLAPDLKALMPTTASRARRWLKAGRAVIVQNDLGIFALKLLAEPSGRNMQPISCGVDPGSSFTGIAVQSKSETLQGLNLNLPRERVSKRLVERAALRRTRRGRRIKRNRPFKVRNHRAKRFDNRKQSKLPPSIRSNKELELRVIKELCQLYPISHFLVERLNKSNTPGFSRAAQGQNFLFEALRQLGKVILVKGGETKNTREYLGLSKAKNKGEQSPEAHVSDAVAIASRLFIRYAPRTTGNQTGYTWKGFVQITRFNFSLVERLPSRPRKLHDLTIKKGGKKDPYGGFNGTHSFRNGDLVRYQTKRSCLTGYISANDLYQFFPKKKRLKQGVSDKNTKLLKRSCNLLVNPIGEVAFLSR